MITSVLLATQLLGAPVADPWFGEDKFKHFFHSFLITSLAASGSRVAGLNPPASRWVGVGTASAIGIFKEANDARVGGPFSIADLTWDAAGIGGALLLLGEAE